MPIEGCHQVFVAIAVQQWSPMVVFYQHLFDQPPNPHMDRAYAEFQVAGLKLGLFSPHETHRPEFSNPAQSAISLCLEVENLEQSRAAIDAAYSVVYDLTSHGCNASPLAPQSVPETDEVDQNSSEQKPEGVASRPHTPLTRQLYGEITIASHGRECYAYDPDGNRLILHEAKR